MDFSTYAISTELRRRWSITWACRFRGWIPQAKSKDQWKIVEAARSKAAAVLGAAEKTPEAPRLFEDGH